MGRKAKAAPGGVDELRFDRHNFRDHDEYNLGLIEASIEEVGYARSVLADGQNELIAGNGVVQVAQQRKGTRIKVVDSDGRRVIAVRRRGLTAEQKERLSLWDNQTAATSAWNRELLSMVRRERDILGRYFYDDEIEALLAAHEQEQVLPAQPTDAEYAENPAVARRQTHAPDASPMALLAMTFDADEHGRLVAACEQVAGRYGTEGVAATVLAVLREEAARP